MVRHQDGQELIRREMKTDVPPLQEREYAIPFEIPVEPGEYAVTASFRLKQDEAWAAAGYEIAFGQNVWTVRNDSECCRQNSPALRVVRGDRNVGIFGDGFSAMYSMEQGILISYTVCGREMLKTPPRPVFWRAPINNDDGNGMQFRYAKWKTADLYAAPMGMDRLKADKGQDPVSWNPDGSISLGTWWTAPGQPGLEWEMVTTVHPGGRTEISLKYDPLPGMGDMPVFGIGFKMDADYDRIRYYGLGPEENYTDRREGARLGIFETTAENNMTPYLVPQECGNRTGIRWAEVTDFRGRGLRFTGDRMEFCALPWTAHEIECAAHPCELPRRHYTVIRAAKQQMGVGGDDSWGARTHDEYLIDVSRPLSFTFSIEPVL